MEPSSSQHAADAINTFGLFGFLVVVVVLIFSLVVNWRIATKAGYNGALSLLMFIPFVNLAIMVLFAFTKWPIENALTAAQQPQVNVRATDSPFIQS